jgi:hypothetical protein
MGANWVFINGLIPTKGKVVGVKNARRNKSGVWQASGLKAA